MADVSTDVVMGEAPLEADAGLLASYDFNPLDNSGYKKDREALLVSRTRNATQFLLNTIFKLPISRDLDYGPLASLPRFTSLLPREKSLPKPKPLTKWERFARKKGIVKRKKDKMIFDEESQKWVPRWGYKGANKTLDDQWLVEVPNTADDEFRPDKAAARELKERRAKNETQRQRNIARGAAEMATAVTDAPKRASALGSGVAPKARRRAELEADVLRARGSTASMGRFDKHLEGETKPRGVKRQYQPNEMNTTDERKANLALLGKIGRGGSDVNMRKAIKYASDGQGSKAFIDRKQRERAPAKRRK
ncbi:Rhodanese- sulfurtransferase [Malassezia vespertilionis]|uniref:Ribosome biogenesis regulatory protein n=1 Tax=Malassezia vespertilionis TaxID=2020962 RepID=A0A2N1JGC1_9BASI|nr:Rhodanese- sulfurtransferase [Malassezia vespertilionis]PKI85586.1 Rrs1p [Malassezia vespertilionis]WFD05201.1 Rhodanese- sulfurtransferase [Malassezia vespertilionis]